MAADVGRRLVLLRHGQTEWNATHRAQGHADVDLDEFGREQAAQAASALSTLPPAAVVSSDLVRAVSTAGIVAQASGLSVRQDPRLREFDLGERTGITMADYSARYPDEYALFRAGQYDVVPGGEPAPQVIARMRAGIEDALASVEPGQFVIVVTHGAALKLVVLDLLGLPQSGAASLRAMDNCGWSILEESAPGGRLRLTAYNLRPPGLADFVAPGGVG